MDALVIVVLVVSMGILKSMVAVWFTKSVNSAWVTVAKPSPVTSSVYLPGGMSSRTYSPVVLVVAVFFKEVSVFVNVTVAPGMTAPEGSFTVPLTEAVERCASARDGRASHTPASISAHTIEHKRERG